MANETFQRILIADDGSPEGQRAATVGLRMAAKLEAEVILLGIAEPPNVGAAGEGLPVEAPEAKKQRIEQRFYEYFKLGRTLEIEMNAEIVEGWSRAKIQECARANSVDLIIVGDRKLNWIERWFIRSNAEVLLHRSTCSIMGIR